MEHLKYQETPQIDEIRKLDFIRFPLLNASYLIRTVGFFSIILIALFQIPDYLPENWELLSILGVVWWVSMFVYRILFKTNFIEIHERILSTLELLDTHKRKIHLNYDILFSYMRSDLTLTGINPEILLNIKNQIQTVTKSIEEYPRIFPDIGKLKWHLLIFYRPFRYLNLIRSLLFAEKKEL